MKEVRYIVRANMYAMYTGGGGGQISDILFLRPRPLSSGACMIVVDVLQTAVVPCAVGEGHGPGKVARCSGEESVPSTTNAM